MASAQSTGRGIVYACSDARWLPETVRSAESCRHFMPDLQRELYLTRALASEINRLTGLFSKVVLVDAAYPTRPRFEAALQTELTEAILIDGDTLFLAPVPELFDVLKHFDVGLVAAPQYLSPMGERIGVYDRLPPVPASISEWNGGLIVARMDDTFREMVSIWHRLFLDCTIAGYLMDQAALRSALVNSRLRVATLPNNYNFRANVGQDVAGVVKILHAHGELIRIARYVNNSTAMRVYIPKPEDIHGFAPKATATAGEHLASRGQKP
jgi:hypothetical protein